jgi:hypothetical protein
MSKNESWLPCPRDIVAEIELQDFDRERPACDAAGFLYVWKLKLDGVKLTERKIAKRMGWTRHRSKLVINRVDSFWMDWQENMCRPKTDQERTKDQPEPDQSDAGSKPDMKEEAAKPQPKADQETAIHTGDIIKDKLKQTKEYIRPLGRGLRSEWMTKDVVKVYEHWLSFNERARKIRKDQIKTIRAALRQATADECCSVLDYAYKAPSHSAHVSFWREKGFLDVTNLLNREKLDRNIELADQWKRGEMHAPQPKTPKLSALPVQRLKFDDL